MKSLCRLLNSSTLHSMILLFLVASVTGCAETRYLPKNEPPPSLPKTWTAEQSRSAIDYSKKVQNYLVEVQNYLLKVRMLNSETPSDTTQ